MLHIRAAYLNVIYTACMLYIRALCYTDAGSMLATYTGSMLKVIGCMSHIRAECYIYGCMLYKRVVCYIYGL